ncbi:MAG: chromosome segregation protein SMC, partial [Oscillospiraceae bacterium]|nr:chromosome segregation protein SMC [Oscillospiraceae bacterium]
DVDADEVVIGRRYYRSGDSEYTINGQQVRLKDIYELFLDTGLGRDGYSIIGQGRIAEIVGAKSAERREIFEEASGIAKYRYRKNEAQRRLAATEDNLVRLRDILGEKESRLGPLEKESEKATKFLALAARRKELEVTLWVDGIRRARDTVRTQQRGYETARADYDRLTAEIEALDAQAEEIRAQVQAQILAIERANGDIRRITEEQAGSESRIAVLNNDIAHNDAAIAARREEIRQGEEGQEAIAAEIAAAEQALADTRTRSAELQGQVQALEQRLAEIQAQSMTTGERRGQVTARLAGLTDEQTACRVARAASESAAEAAVLRQETARTEQAAAAEGTEALETELADTRVYLTRVQEKLARLENIQKGLRLKLDGRQKQLDEADAAEQKISRELEVARQRQNLLQDLERNMEGYQYSVKAVMRAAQNHRLRGIIVPVGTLLNVQKGCEAAIETALGAAAQNIVVDGETGAKAAIAFLKQEKAGRATFLPLDTMQGSTLDASRLPEGARVASTLVEYDPRYERVVANLLGRILVVEDMDDAARVARQMGYRNRVVTLDGQVVNAGGSFTGGSMSRSAGLFSRRQEIDELKQKIAKMEKKQEEAEAATDKWKAEVDTLTAQLTATSSEAVVAGGDKIRAEMEVRRLEAALQQSQDTAAALTAELDELTGRIARCRAEAAAAQAQEEALAGQIAELETELAELSGSDDAFLATRARLSDELGEKRLAKLAADKDAERLSETIGTLHSRTGESGAHRLELEEAIRQLEAANEENRRQIAEIEEEKAESSARIAALEEAIRAATEQRLAAEGRSAEQSQRVRALSDEREKMNAEMARQAERKAAAEIEYDQTVAKLWEEYQLTPGDAAELCVEFENVTDLRRQVAEVRGKIRSLGNVNVGAIEEFREVSESYNTLKKQVTDVEKSKAELTRIIGGLEEEMRTQFIASFKEINAHFGRIFRELFGGGSAQLKLADDTNVLESGIEIQVSPPGKVIKNLSALSGGEQSLVAICIYFAILAVNPAPFCILDEIEAALDDVNVVRYAQYLRRICTNTQFIVITHRRGTMESADVLYGVTMQEDGVSKLLKLDLENVDASLVH